MLAQPVAIAKVASSTVFNGNRLKRPYFSYFLKGHNGSFHFYLQRRAHCS